MFLDANSTNEEIAKAGEHAIVSLYGGDKIENLDKLRLRKFYEKTSRTTAVEPCTLPPTSSAAKYHSMCVYHQVQVWHSWNIPAEQWGWKVSGGRLIPILTDNPLASHELLQGIRCTCKTGCYTLRCTCRVNRLDC